jgi:hypothetical protein
VRRTVVAAMAAGVVAVVAVVVAAVVLRAADDDGPSRAEVETYEEAILPLVREWGRIEVQGMRPAVADLQSGEGVPAATVAGEARAWHAAFERLRSQLRAVAAPEGMEEVAHGFDRAMADYLEAAATFEQAASAADAEERSRLVDRGITVVQRGADRYDDASALLQEARRSVGLPPTDDFPGR